MVRAMVVEMDGLGTWSGRGTEIVVMEVESGV